MQLAIVKSRLLKIREQVKKVLSEGNVPQTVTFFVPEDQAQTLKQLANELNIPGQDIYKHLMLWALDELFYGKPATDTLTTKPKPIVKDVTIEAKPISANLAVTPEVKKSRSHHKIK